MLVHQATGGVAVALVDRIRDLSVLAAYGLMEPNAEGRPGKAGHQHREDGLSRDREQGITARIKHDRVEVGVVGELLLRIDLRARGTDRLPQARDVGRSEERRVGKECRL